MSTSQVTKPRFVREVMSKDPVCVYAYETAKQLAKVLDENGISGAPVVDPQDRVIGVVSRTDLVHRLLEGPITSRSGSFFSMIADGIASGFDVEELGHVEDFMSEEPYCVSPEEPIGAVAQRMAEDRIHRAIVVDDAQRPLGIVTSLDLLRAVPLS